ncbi:DUF4939 domain-containing protein, partial [Alkalibacillus haloalkaliphilus]|uniref:DUF4939 domain-containing protein n=1 Tax=Alkalibacillus haloalkaliphilus TaxID=94136 RepID=UPI002936A49E
DQEEIPIDPPEPTHEAPPLRMATLTNGMGDTKVNPPAIFTGKRTQLKTFINDLLLYFMVNARTYDTDTKKIAFMLSYMRDGTAGPWKEVKLEEQQTKEDWGGFPAFLEDLRKQFKPSDEEGDARTSLRLLKQ